MPEQSVTLKTGQHLNIKLLQPPLSSYADKVGCWTDIRDELLGGQMTPWLFTPYFVGEIDGEVVGSMSYYTPTDTRDVGVVEFVHTAEKHRQKGIASALMARLIERFRADGGLGLYLCTINPHAGTLYENHGFWYHVGDGMRYLAPDAQDFDRTYLAFCGKARIRDATWADLPRLSVLYNHPQPEWYIKDYLTQSFRHTRYESHFVKLMKGIENQKGSFLVLENPEQRVVGAAVLKRLDTFYEQHVAMLSFRVCPHYFNQATDLLNAASEKAKELAVQWLQTCIADCDDDQKELVAAAGFSEEARLRSRLSNGGENIDLLVYSLPLSHAVKPLCSPGDYYGGRQSWQEERIASMKMDLEPVRKDRL